MITVQGFQWCPEPKSVGLASLTANILCTTHNSAFSLLDSSAQETLKTLGEARGLLEVRRNLKPRRIWQPVRYKVDGSLLESWFMKTTINLFHVVSDGAVWYLTEAAAAQPPVEFVEVALRRRRLASPFGLYSAEQEGARIGPEGHLSFQPIFAGIGRFAGARFRFQGFKFLLWICPMTPPLFDANGKSVAAMLHLKRIKFTVGGASSHTIDFKW